MKKWLLRKKHQVELARKRGWRGYWVCLKGTTLLFYPCDSREGRHVEAAPKHLIIVDGAIMQPIPEHPQRDFIFCLSTAFGDAYLFQVRTRTTMMTGRKRSPHPTQIKGGGELLTSQIAKALPFLRSSRPATIDFFFLSPGGCCLRPFLPSFLVERKAKCGEKERERGEGVENFSFVFSPNPVLAVVVVEEDRIIRAGIVIETKSRPLRYYGDEEEGQPPVASFLS